MHYVRKLRNVILGTVILGLFSSASFAFDGYVDVTNDTGYTIYYLYVSNEHSDEWEEDVLGTDVLSSGETVRVRINDAASEYFDIKAEDSDGETYTRWRVNVATQDVTFTLADLDTGSSSSSGVSGVRSTSSTYTPSFDGYVEVTNATGYDIYYLYVSNNESSSWEEDVLGADILYDGQTVRVNVNDAASQYFDIKAEDEDGDTYTLWNVDISRRDVTFTLADLD